jgi:hypothetical protein
MSLGPAYGAAGALPYIEIVQTATDDITYTTSYLTWSWTSVKFDTGPTNWSMNLTTNELTIKVKGTYRIELEAFFATTSADTRVVATVERDPGGGYAFEVGSSIFQSSDGSTVSGYSTFTLACEKDDKLRVRVRRLAGTAPTSTDGANGPIWRITKLD